MSTFERGGVSASMAVIMPDTPLYCPCGNRLGLLRSDGTFVSRQKGRIITVEGGRVEVTCEACGRTTPVDKLETVV